LKNYGIHFLNLGVKYVIDNYPACDDAYDAAPDAKGKQGLSEARSLGDHQPNHPVKSWTRFSASNPDLEGI